MKNNHTIKIAAIAGMLVFAVLLPLAPARAVESQSFTPSAGTVTVTTSNTGTTVVNSGFTAAKLSSANCVAGTCSDANSWNAGFTATKGSTSIKIETLLTYDVPLANISNVDFTFKGCWHGEGSRNCNNLDNPELGMVGGQVQFKILNGASWELLGPAFTINHNGDNYLADKYATRTASKSITDSYIQNGQVKIVMVLTGKTVGDYDVQQVTDYAGITVTYSQSEPDPDPDPEPTDDSRPNILVIYTDDQRWDTLQYMPVVTERILNEGTLFNNSFVTTALCCPSRATFLTGEYAHEHGIWHNDPPLGGFSMFDDDETLATWLQDAGYRTGQIGKYFNGYNINYVPPGWDEWHGTSWMYYNWKMNDNGVVTNYGSASSDYSTDVMRDKAIEFIQSSDEPFFLWWSVHAPHSPYTAAPRHVGTCDTMTFQHPPSYSEDDPSDKPFWIANNNQFGGSNDARNQVCSLKAVDEAVDAMLDAVPDNTIVIYTSDNGFLWGEHNLLHKNQIYEEAIRVPLVIVHPNVTLTSINEIALNIDLAPTILELANVTIPASIDGESLMSLMNGSATTWRDKFIIEQIRPNEEGYDIRAHGVRTETAKWIQHVDDDTQAILAEELYDLIADPYELQNLLPSNNTAILDLRAQLMQEYDSLLAQ